MTRYQGPAQASEPWAGQPTGERERGTLGVRTVSGIFGCTAKEKQRVSALVKSTGPAIAHGEHAVPSRAFVSSVLR